MKKTFLSLFVIVSVVMTMFSCAKPEEDDVYVGTISYVLNETVPSQVVLSPIITFFQEKLDGIADVTNTNGSFVIDSKDGKQDAVKKILAEAENELTLLMEGELKDFVRSCDVMVYKNAQTVLEVHFRGIDSSVGGHDNTQGTVPGFEWQ